LAAWATMIAMAIMLSLGVRAYAFEQYDIPSQ
jgi:hypothetical protein